MKDARIALAEFCRIMAGGRRGLSGNDFVPTGFPAYGAGGLNGYLPEYEFDEPAVILSAIGARCGKCFFADGKWASLANTQLIFPDPQRADARFLWYQLNDERRWHRSGTGQPFIKPMDVKAHRVYLPPLLEQRRIANVLDRADALRAKRAETRALLTSLQLAIFVEMFGDPTENPKHWEVEPLESLCSLSGQYGAGVPATQYAPDLPRYVRITDITDDGDLSASPVGPAGDPSAWTHLLLQDGDLLFARSGATVGKTYLHKSRAGRCVFAGYLIRFRPDPARVLPEYLFHFTRTGAYRAWVGSRQRVVAQPNINARQYAKELFVPVPPIELQRVFVARLKVIEIVGLRTEAASRLSDELLTSLRDRAFRGEL